MTITIKGLTKDRFVDLTHKLDLFAGECGTTTIREEFSTGDADPVTLYGISINNTSDFTLKLGGDGVQICRSGVIPSYFLPASAFDRLFIL